MSVSVLDNGDSAVDKSLCSWHAKILFCLGWSGKVVEDVMSEQSSEL